MLLAEKSKSSKGKLAGESIQKFEAKRGFVIQKEQNFNSNGDYEETKSARETHLADGYRLEYDAADDKIYCLAQRQTSKSMCFFTFNVVAERKKKIAITEMKPLIIGQPQGGQG